MPPLRERVLLLVFDRVLTEIRVQGQRTRDALDAMEKRLMTQFEDIEQKLDAIDQATNQSAAKLTEVDTDIDDLITQLSSGAGLTAQQAQAVATRLSGLASTVTSQAAFLTTIAAKHDNVVPEPPTEPPTEPASDNG